MASTFSAQLFYLLNIIHIRIPPLRERREDIPVLLDHYLRLFSSCHRVEPPQLSEQAKASLLERDWIGNLRELQDHAERLVVESHTGAMACSGVRKPHPQPSASGN